MIWCSKVSQFVLCWPDWLILICVLDLQTVFLSWVLENICISTLISWGLNVSIYVTTLLVWTMIPVFVLQKQTSGCQIDCYQTRVPLHRNWLPGIPAFGARSSFSWNGVQRSRWMFPGDSLELPSTHFYSNPGLWKSASIRVQSLCLYVKLIQLSLVSQTRIRIRFQANLIHEVFSLQQLVCGVNH